MTTRLAIPLGLGLAIALLVAVALGWATPKILRRLPEPPPDDEDDDKIPYAELATRPFAVLVGASSAVALTVVVMLSPTMLPASALPVWLVLGTVGVLLAAIDARTTWLPLPLTRVAWAATAASIVVGWLLAGWRQAALGLAGFLVAGALFGTIWLLTRGGFGFGDVRYAPLVGAATASVSLELLAWGLVLGSLVGALVGLVRLATGRRGAFAYAPSILAGGYLAVVLAWLTT